MVIIVMYIESIHENPEIILNPTIPESIKIESKKIAIFNFDLNTFSIGFTMTQISKTELRLEKIISLIFNQKATNKYSAKPKPKVTKVTYMKEVRTTLARIPNRSAIR